jgi:cytochrome c biogenesis protein CcmG/thiol:disulfide interchange protein DsbE
MIAKRFLVGLSLAGALLLHAATASAGPRAGDPAPALIGQTLDGQPFDLGKLRGHVLVVNVWATWCPPCRAEMPMLDAFQKAHMAEGLVLIGLSADRHRDLAEARRVMKAFGYPAVMASDAKTNGFGSPTVLPVTYVIDAKGVVKAVLSSGDTPLTAAQLEAAVSSAD